MSEWQPIDTAPKDGTEFLAVNLMVSCVGFRVVYFDDEAEEPYVWHVDDAGEGFNHHRDFFTHWMPLPNPPPSNMQVRAALETALAVREPDAGDWAAFGASDAACYKWPEDTSEHKALRAAYIEGAAAQADLIERQAEEIARLTTDISDLVSREKRSVVIVARLIAERAELIEALRPFARAVYNDNGDVTISHASIGEYMRARALLERLGVKV